MMSIGTTGLGAFLGLVDNRLFKFLMAIVGQEHSRAFAQPVGAALRLSLPFASKPSKVGRAKGFMIWVNADHEKKSMRTSHSATRIPTAAASTIQPAATRSSVSIRIQVGGPYQAPSEYGKP